MVKSLIKNIHVKLPSFGTPNVLRTLHLLKKLLKKSSPFCGQQAPVVRISSLVYDLSDYHFVTANIIQLIVDFRYILLVHGDVKGSATGYAEYASAYPPMNILSIPAIRVAGNYSKVDLKTYYTF